MTQDSPEQVKRDWKEIVENNKDSLLFCPDSLLEETKEWLAKREELERELNRIAKIEVETKVKLENLVLKIRQHLDDTGFKNVWTGEVGFQSEALKEGVHIISIGQ
jgi:sugar-specific transcriptional regulator TrmB